MRCRTRSRLITKVLLPCLIFYATVTGCTRQAIADNLPMIALAAGFYALIICVTFILAKVLRMPVDKGHIFMFCFMFCFIFGNVGFLLHLTPLPSELVTSITLIAALPTMTIVPMIAAQRGPFGDYTAGITVGTLVFSLVTIPLVTFLVL